MWTNKSPKLFDQLKNPFQEDGRFCHKLNLWSQVSEVETIENSDFFFAGQKEEALQSYTFCFSKDRKNQ